MFYNRVIMKKSALKLLKPRWDKAAFVGFFVTAPILLFYALYFMWFMRFALYSDNAPETAVASMILKVIPFLIGFVAILAILIFALCRWSIQLAKSAQTENPDAPPAPTLKDFFRFFSPISIGLFFYCALRMFLWMLVLYATMIPFILISALVMRDFFIASIILGICAVILFIFVYLYVLAKFVSYSMAFYAFADNPELSVTEAAKLAVEVTNGFRTNLFMTQLSFFGWFMLGSVTFGIALFWVLPYFSQTLANSWLFIRSEKTQAV